MCIRDSWQITVYEPDFQTPECIKGKVFYQIFPDRFCEGIEDVYKRQMMA